MFFPLSDLDSLFSVDEYKHQSVQNGQHQTLSFDVKHTSSSFSIKPLNLCGVQMSRRCAKSDRVDTSRDEACVNQPYTFRRIAKQVGIKRFNFLCFDNDRHI